ncbi:phage tail protein [Flavobacterium pallidum]|uniref:Phage tail protein n=1 Tax=Flavobacterium pallidum TaxID=2172098 RepID=A0A2S1SHB8_9FLAO|nr:tail fiber protein [Flavobacterium pallidum]AWI25771.1 phage tail protein [Flavobacterium pallidum]
MEPILGSLMIFPGNFPPYGWAFCDGSLLPISRYTALFSILGTTYGGDGKVTFALPDLRGRVPVNAGTGNGLSPRDLGESYGMQTMTMLPANMPMHTHVTTGTAGIGANTAVDETSDTPVNNFLCSNANPIYAGGSNGVMGNSTVTPGQYTTATGQGIPFTTSQPLLGLNYCIAMQGVFPQRQ